jgi:hypothetical protein
MTFVYVVQPDETAAVRQVSVTQQGDTETVLASGAEPAERVVVSGFVQLADGRKVTVANKENTQSLRRRKSGSVRSAHRRATRRAARAAMDAEAVGAEWPPSRRKSGSVRSAQRRAARRAAREATHAEAVGAERPRDGTDCKAMSVSASVPSPSFAGRSRPRLAGFAVVLAGTLGY